MKKFRRRGNEVDYLVVGMLGAMLGFLIYYIVSDDMWTLAAIVAMWGLASAIGVIYLVSLGRRYK